MSSFHEERSETYGHSFSFNTQSQSIFHMETEPRKSEIVGQLWALLDPPQVCAALKSCCQTQFQETHVPNEHPLESTGGAASLRVGLLWNSSLCFLLPKP